MIIVKKMEIQQVRCIVLLHDFQLIAPPKTSASVVQVQKCVF